ncbi:MAG TPA: DMT family transporter [Candidatus Limnocylindria bacterium]|nr:DMT family transporter [Candidatus Limnocylindria bacterium]
MRTPRIGQSVTVGISLALGTAAISGLSVFLNGFAVKQFPDPATYTTLKNAAAAVILIGAMVAVGGVPRALGTRRWAGVAALGLIGGSIPFLLFFTGLAQASAPAAAVIHKTLFIWVALLAVIVLRERLGAWQISALGVLVAATLMVQPPAGVAWGGGESLIAIATGMWAVETIVARRLLATVPPLVAGAGRMGFGLLILVGYLVATGRIGVVFELGAAQWAWVIGTGVLLAGYVATWYGALRRAPAAMVAAVLTLGAPITAALQLVTAGAVPAPGPLAGYGLMLVVGGGLAVALLRHAARDQALSPAG